MEELKWNECECMYWASDDNRRRIYGNGHHENCRHHVSFTRLQGALTDLLDGVEAWIDDNEGIHGEVEEPYERLCHILGREVHRWGYRKGDY